MIEFFVTGFVFGLLIGVALVPWLACKFMAREQR